MQGRIQERGNWSPWKMKDTIFKGEFSLKLKCQKGLTPSPFTHSCIRQILNLIRQVCELSHLIIHFLICKLFPRSIMVNQGGLGSNMIRDNHVQPNYRVSRKQILMLKMSYDIKQLFVVITIFRMSRIHFIIFSWRNRMDRLWKIHKRKRGNLRDFIKRKWLDEK